MAEQVNSADWQEKVLDSDVPVLVDFFATWCGPCKRMTPVVEELAAEVAGEAAVYKLDIDDDFEIAQKYGVMSVPTFIAFKGGEPTGKMVGLGTKDDLRALLD